MIEIDKKTIANIPVLEVVDADKKHDTLPLVIFYHGWMSCKERVLTEAYELAKRGIRVALPDAKYHGERQEGEVSSHRQDFWQIIASSVKEMPTLVEYYTKGSGIVKNKLGVAGTSMGAITTSALMTVYPQINAAVSLMGTPCPTKFAHQLIAELPGLDKLPKEFIAEQLSQLEIIDLSMHPERIAKRPFHFWHGTADQTVPYNDDKPFFDSIQGKDYAVNTSFTTAEGQGHKVTYAAQVEMAEKFKKYFEL